MKYIDPSFEIYSTTFLHPTRQAIYDFIEKVARTCYKSENLIKNDYLPIVVYNHLNSDGTISCIEVNDEIYSPSSKAFVERLVKSKHGAMLEHATVYLAVGEKLSFNDLNSQEIADFYRNNPYSELDSRLVGKNILMHYITTNYRVIVENNRYDDLTYMVNASKHHKKRYTVKFITDRGVANEFVRHRLMSFGQESTRYCCYSKEKFGNEITVIRPWWMSENYLYMSKMGPYEDNKGWHILNTETSQVEDVTDTSAMMTLCLMNTENVYNALTTDDNLDKKLVAQDARHILPLGLKTELVVTGYEDAWKHFFDLRYLGATGAPHPEAKRLAEPLYHEFKKLGYI